ncbi:MAG: recombination protein RecA [Clostridia bacterium]|nr:recombination protein RecA [Clostridia bacterium]
MGNQQERLLDKITYIIYNTPKGVTNMIYNKKCEYCGIEFKAKDKKRKYCSGKCKTAMYRSKLPKEPKPIKICINCGKEYTPVHNRKDGKYCSRACKDRYKNDKKPRLTDKNYKKANIIKKQPLTKEQRQIIIGSLLGDGSINLENVFLITQSDKQKEYLDWKVKKLGSIIMRNPKAYHRKNGLTQWHIHSIKHPEIEEIRNKVYINGQKTLGKWINELNELGLAVWYMDDGSFNKNPNSLQCTISSDNFTEEENYQLKEFLKQRFSIEAKVQELKDKRYNILRYRLRINRHEADKLFELIRKYVPQCMKYKIK